MTSNRVVELKHDKTTNRAFVRWQGSKKYFGKWRTKEANAKFAEWLFAHTEKPVFARKRRLRVIDCVQRYMHRCKKYYVEPMAAGPNSDAAAEAVPVPSQEFRNISAAMDVLLCNAGGKKDYALEFGPKKLKAIQEALEKEVIETGAKHEGKKRYARRTINAIINRIRRCFRWCASDELIPGEIVTALEMVPGLKKGRSNAREKEKVSAVDLRAVGATLPFLSPTVADMVRVQFLCGMRPQDVCGMTARGIDRSGDVWIYRPVSHKNRYREQELVKAVPLAAQMILLRLITEDLDRPLFSPFDTLTYFRRKMRKRSGEPSPVKCGRGFYSTSSYGKAVGSAIAKANRAGIKVQHWAPNQLRHSIGTQLRATAGIEAAQLFLGHAKPDATLIYAEVSVKKLSEIAKQVSPLEVASGSIEQP